MVKYRLIYWEQQGLGDPLSHPISRSALTPVLHSQELDQILIQVKTGFSPNKDKYQIHRELTLCFRSQVWYRSGDAYWNDVSDLI